MLKSDILCWQCLEKLQHPRSRSPFSTLQAWINLWCAPHLQGTTLKKKKCNCSNMFQQGALRRRMEERHSHWNQARAMGMCYTSLKKATNLQAWPQQYCAIVQILLAMGPWLTIRGGVMLFFSLIKVNVCQHYCSTDRSALCCIRAGSGRTGQHLTGRLMNVERRGATAAD